MALWFTTLMSRFLLVRSPSPPLPLRTLRSLDEGLLRGARLFLRHLEATGIVKIAAPPSSSPDWQC